MEEFPIYFFCILWFYFLYILYFIVLFLISFAFYSFISYIFPLCFTVLLKQLRRLYTGGFVFQVPPVSDYINAYLRVYCTSLLFTRLVHQPPAYAFGAPTTYL